MGRTRIELLSSGDIEMFEDVSTPLTFAIADIRTPEKRDSHFSKTIKVPATKGNNIRFGHIFDINIKDGTYNANRKAPCTLYIDDVPQLNGFLQILSIEIDDRNDMIYNCSIKGNVNNIFQELGDSEISDLDLSTYNHVLSKSVQKASFTNTYLQGYCYPLIDYGFDSDINNYKVEHLMPAIFVRTYIDKIFSSVGYTYRSTFFDSTHFKNLIIPSIGDKFKYSAAQVLLRLFEASLSAPYTVSAATNTVNQLVINTDVSDVSNQFNTGTYTWTVLTTGYYNVNADVNFYSSGTVLSDSVDTYLLIKKNGTTVIASSYFVNTNNVLTRNVNASNVYLIAGETVAVYIQGFYWNGTPPYTSWIFKINTIVFSNSVNNQTLQAGDTVVINETIPTKIKQKDLLLDIIRMFNLYVEVDKNDSKKLNIETRDDFYTSGTIRDWTYKIDNSKPIEITPMGELDYKKFKYSYKDDKDYYNKKYLEDYDIGYGNREVEIDNEFLTNVNETKVMFSPTPLVALPGDDRIIPKIWEVDSSNIIKQKPFNIRLLYNGGVKTTTLPYQYVDSIQGTTTETTYLYAGHLNSPTAPTYDLNFGVPNELYYDTNIYTNANLFNNYHKRFIDEITDKDSKIVTAYFYLTPKDIDQLDFRDSFYFENQYFRLNKISDYNPIDESITKCEFIKIKNGISFNGTTAVVTNGFSTGFTGSSDTLDKIPILNNIKLNPNVIVFGNENVIGNNLINSYINGSYNYVNGGNNINLLGSSGNTIYDGLSNVTLINTSGTVVSESNSLYINGVSITSGTINALSGEWNQTTYSSGDYYSDSGSWIVDFANVYTNRYVIIGKTITWNVYLTNSIVTGSPTILYINIPNSEIAANVMFLDYPYVSFSGTRLSSITLESPNSSYIRITRDSGAPFTAGSISVSFSITFEIQ